MLVVRQLSRNRDRREVNVGTVGVRGEPRHVRLAAPRHLLDSQRYPLEQPAQLDGLVLCEFVDRVGVALGFEHQPSRQRDVVDVEQISVRTAEDAAPQRRVARQASGRKFAVLQPALTHSMQNLVHVEIVKDGTEPGRARLASLEA